MYKFQFVKLIVVVSLIITGCVVVSLIITGCEESPKETASSKLADTSVEEVGQDDDQTIVVSVYEDGRLIESQNMEPGHEIYADIASYICQIERGKSTIKSYAPGLIIKTDSIKINIKSDFVVASFWNNRRGHWEPTILPKNSESIDIEQTINAYISQKITVP